SCAACRRLLPSSRVTSPLLPGSSIIFVESTIRTFPECDPDLIGGTGGKGAPGNRWSDNFAKPPTEIVGMLRGGEWGGYAHSGQMIGMQLAYDWHVLPAYCPPIVLTPFHAYRLQRGNTTEGLYRGPRYCVY